MKGLNNTIDTPVEHWEDHFKKPLRYKSGRKNLAELLGKHVKSVELKTELKAEVKQTDKALKDKRNDEKAVLYMFFEHVKGLLNATR